VSTKADGAFLIGLRRFVSRISIRLLAFNVLLVFLPVASVSYLEIYEGKLLQAQEQSMIEQGRVLAAALSERGPLDESLVESILVRLDQRTRSRIRVIDQQRRLVSDTSQLGPQREPGASGRLDEGLRASWLYRVGSSMFRFVDTLVAGPRPVVGEEFYSAQRPFFGAEIDLALSGQYGAATRITPGGQRSVTLYSALPIEHDDAVVGVVLVSQSTFQILQDLYEVRLATFRFLLVAVGVAAVLSLLVSTTISRPLRRLQRQAHALLDRRGRLTGRFKGSERLDEIGDLSRSLSELSARLEERMQFIESFAADVSHEFKNPLTSMRSAAEMLAEVEEPGQRARFARMVQVDIARLEKLLSEVREITILDASSDAEDELPVSVDLNAVLRGVAERERYAALELELDLADGEVVVAAGPDRLARVFENLIDNAAAFSKNGHVRLSSRVEGHEAVAVVDDDGPGIPPEHGDKVFDRFFSYRPDANAAGSSDHSGLGLAIVRAILERRGGSIRTVSSTLGGAGFEVRLNLA
jgi:two-component system sensor histidine kinase ChvG